MEAYKVVVAHEKKGGKIKTENFYFDKPKDAQSACKYLIQDYKNDERTSLGYLKVTLQILMNYIPLNEKLDKPCNKNNCKHNRNFECFKFKEFKIFFIMSP